jgi:hypothetical protein
MLPVGCSCARRLTGSVNADCPDFDSIFALESGPTPATQARRILAGSRNAMSNVISRQKPHSSGLEDFTLM